MNSLRSTHIWRSVPLAAMALLCWQLAACSGTPKQPEWLDDPHTDFPATRYLSAIGEARGRETAGQRALANIARTFSVALSETSLDVAEARVSISQDERAVENTQKVSRSITTEVQLVLEGARVVEHWQSADGAYFALAILDKPPAAKRFSRTVRDIDAQTVDRVTYARQRAPNPVAALTALEQARLLQLQRNEVNRNLSVVSNRGIDSPQSTSDIERMIRNGLATLAFAADAESISMQDSLKAAIAQLGIQYDTDSSYVLQGILDTVPVYEKQGWYWLRGSVHLRLLHHGEPIANKRWPIKLSGTDPGLVTQRAQDLLSADLHDYLYAMLTSNP
jgi:hypothetical protein